MTSDASIKYGTFKFKSELDILNIKNKDDFFIIYKPHPDVIANNRDGINLEIIKKKINLLADNYSTNECIDCADEVHTLTSLSGFEALIRGKKVFTYGAPFYAGWGLTEDIDKSSPAFNRRIKKLNLEGLVYGTLIKYPIYWDYQKKKISTCEKTIKKIIKERNEYWKINKKSLIEMPFFLRQIKKVSNFLNSFFY